MTEHNPEIYAMHFMYRGIPTIVEVNHDGEIKIGRSASPIVVGYPKDQIPVSIAITDVEAEAFGEKMEPGERAYRVVSAIPVSEDMDTYIAKMLFCLQYKEAALMLYKGFVDKQRQFSTAH